MKATVNLKALQIVTALVFVFIAGAACGDVTIKRVPMNEHQAAITDGSLLYQEFCAVCHGNDGKGDGPAISALKSTPSDLTVLTLINDGTFPRKDVETMLTGRFREETHFDSCNMPSWYWAFSGAYPKWPLHRRHAYAMSQIDRLTDYLETIQVSYPDQLGYLSYPPGLGPAQR